MSLATNIVRRGSRYYLRVAVPKDLQGRFGRREVWKSLHTADPREARRRAPDALRGLHNEFDEYRHRLRPEPEEVDALVRRHYADELAKDESKRAAPWGADNIAERLLGYATGDGVVRQAQSALGHGSVRIMGAVADQLIETSGLLIEEGSPAYDRLCHGLARAQVEIEKRRLERRTGDYTGQPSDPLLKEPAGSSPPTDVDCGSRRAETILELYDGYARDNAERMKPDTLDQNRKIVAMFVDFVGQRASSTAITRRAVRNWKDALYRWPKKAAEISEFKGLSFNEVIERNKRVGKPPISQRTINKYLSGFGAFCSWLRTHDHLAENPVEGLLIPLDKGKQTVVSYTDDQLLAIFSSPLFVGCRGEGKEHEPGDHRIRDHRYWLPLLALFSGARLGELAQLLVTDVKQVDGHWVFHITTEGSPEKKLKSKSAYRVVPVHSELAELGLLEHRNQVRSTGAKRLFPEVRPDVRGQISGFVSRWYGRYLMRIGLKTDASLNFHSFRHTFIDALRRARYLDHQLQPLVGHSNSGTTGRYGILPEGELSWRVQMVEAVRYPGVDFAHLT